MATYRLGESGKLIASDSEKKKKKGTTYTIGENGKLIPKETEDVAESTGWFQSGALEDGFSLKNIGKTVRDTLADAGTDILTGMVGMGEQALDSLLTVAPYIAQGQYYQNGGAYQPLAQQKAQEELFSAAKAGNAELVAKDLYDEKAVTQKLLTGVGVSSNYLENEMERNSILGAKADSLAQSGGQLLTTAGLSAMGVPWWMTTGISSMGAETENALNQGATLDEAAVSGLVSAGAEILTEKISGGIKFGGKTLDDALTKQLSRVISNKVVSTLAKLGVDTAGEGAEEVLSGLLGAVGQKLTYADDKELGELFSKEDALDSFIGGAILGGISGTGKAVNNVASDINKKGQKNKPSLVADAENAPTITPATRSSSASANIISQTNENATKPIIDTSQDIGPVQQKAPALEDDLPIRTDLSPALSLGDVLEEAGLVRQDVSNSKDILEDIGPVREDLNNDLDQQDIPIRDEPHVAKVLAEEPKEDKKKNRAFNQAMGLMADKGFAIENLAKKTKNRELEGRYNSIALAEGRAQDFIGNGDGEVKALNDIRKEVEKSGLTQEFSEYVYHLHNADRMSLESNAQEQAKLLIDENPILKDLNEKGVIGKIADKVKASSGKLRLENVLNKKYLDKKLETFYRGVKKEDAAKDLLDKIKKLVKLQEVKNKPVFGDAVAAEDSKRIAAEFEAKYPQLKGYANDLYKISDYLRKMLVDNGVISQEASSLWAEMYPHYVPIRRANSNGLNINVPLDTNRTGVNAPVKGATGGNSDILPLFNTMAQRAMQTYKAVAKNRFGLELKNTLGNATATTTADVDGIIDSIDTHEDLLQEGKNGSSPTFTVFDNGERVTFEISEDVYDALKPTNKTLAYTNKLANTVSNIHRGVLTEYNPVFMATNAIKDAQDVLINSQHPAKTYANFPKALKEIVTNGKWATEYVKNGGEQNSYFDKQSNSFQKEKSMFVKTIGFPLNVVSKVNNVIERLPRLAEYIASREAGRSIDVSMLDAARVTTNFNAGGDFTKFLNRNGCTFLNASVQGAMQQVRNVREAKTNGLKGWMQLAAKFAVAGLPTVILNGFLWDDDEDYEELSDYVKQNYYMVAKYDDDKFVRIPKGRTLSVIQTALSQTMGALTGDDETDLKTFLKNALFNLANLAPNNPIENNILAPISDVANNETWYGEDLVPTRLQDLPANEQYDESTDAISRWLGDNLDPLELGPYKINYLLDQYTGGLGDVVLPMFTPEAESGDDTLIGKIGAPLRDKFTADSVFNNQNVSDFYEISDMLTTNAKASGATHEDILSNKYINSVKEEIGNLYAEKRRIQNSDMSDSEKYRFVRKIQEKINALAEEALGEYDNVNKASGRGTYYASVGDRQFRWNQKDTDVTGTWEKLTEEQIERQNEVTKALGITKDEYWSNAKDEYEFAYDNPEKYSFFQENGITYDDYKSADENGKRALTWAYENPGKYTMSKVIADDFMTYYQYKDKLSDIRADKDAKGKTIAGSAKKKKVVYINNLDLDYGQKIILFKSLYKSDDTYNADIVEYLNNRDDVGYKDMVTILEELGFTVLSDGTVKWD